MTLVQAMQAVKRLKQSYGSRAELGLAQHIHTLHRQYAGLLSLSYGNAPRPICNRFIACINLMQVALIAALVTPTASMTILICMVVGGGGCSCMLLVQPSPAAPMLVLSFCNLHWWCFSFNQLAKTLHLHTWW